VKASNGRFFAAKKKEEGVPAAPDPFPKTTINNKEDPAWQGHWITRQPARCRTA
jgi:hypothetical protein